MERNRTRATQAALHKIGEKMISENLVLTQTAFNEVERRLLEAGCWSQWPLQKDLPMSRKIHQELQALRSKIR
jgi:hypothetical protein